MTCTQIILMKYQEYPFSMMLAGVFNTLLEASEYTRKISGITLPDEFVLDLVFGECSIVTVPHEYTTWVAYETGYPCNQELSEIVIDSCCYPDSPWKCLCENCGNVIIDTVTDQEEWLDITLKENSGEILKKKLEQYMGSDSDRNGTVILASIYCLVKSNPGMMSDEILYDFISKLDEIFSQANASDYRPRNMLGYFYNRKFNRN